MRIDLDIPVSCTDGTLGTLANVVVDSGTRRLTHVGSAIILRGRGGDPTSRAAGSRAVPDANVP